MQIDWDYILKVTIGVLTVIGLLWKGGKVIFAKITKEYAAIKEVHNKVGQIHKEMYPNGGSSVKDIINAIKKQQLEQGTAILEINKGLKENTYVTRELAAKYQWSLDNEDSPIFESDAEGNCLWVNSKYCELTKHSHAFFLQNGWKNVIHPDEREKISQDWFSAVKDKRTFECEYRFVDKDNKEIPVKCSASYIKISDEDGRYLGKITVK